MINFLKRIFSSKPKPKLYTTVHHKSEDFDTTIQWADPSKIDFDEALERVDYCVDSPAMYSNEPTKDIQSWQYIQVMARIGYEFTKRKKDGTLKDWL